MHGHAMNIGSSTQRRLACLGDASRYRLVMALATGARCVTDLAAAVGLSQSCTTRHLQALQAVGLVERVRDGKRVMIRLKRDEPEAGSMLDWVLERVRSGAATGSGSRPATGGRSQGKKPVRAPRGMPEDETAPPSANGDEEAARPEPMRRPDTIEDYLL